MWTPLQTAQHSLVASLEQPHLPLPHIAHPTLLGQLSIQVQHKSHLARRPLPYLASQEGSVLRWCMLTMTSQEQDMTGLHMTELTTELAGTGSLEGHTKSPSQGMCGCAGDIPAQKPLPTASPSPPAQQDAAAASSSSSVHLPNLPSADRSTPLPNLPSITPHPANSHCL